MSSMIWLRLTWCNIYMRCRGEFEVPVFLAHPIVLYLHAWFFAWPLRCFDMRFLAQFEFLLWVGFQRSACYNASCAYLSFSGGVLMRAHPLV